MVMKRHYTKEHWRTECWFQRQVLKDNKMDSGDIVAIEIDWWPSFALLPHRTVGGKWIFWQRCYKRIVWRYTGFTDEPFTEYGELFDVIAGR
jgi:hypothetical protein